MDFYARLHQLLCQDTTNRGLPSATPAPDFSTLTDTLLSAERTVILTGFSVDCKTFYCGETDGPGGAAALARALSAIGSSVTIVTDQVSFPQVHAAINCLVPEASVVCLPPDNTFAFGSALLKEIQPTHFISIERPGKGLDGHFHSMRGAVIDHMVTDSDFLLALSKELGAVTISIGDGGNELGMGTFTQEIVQNVPHGAKIASVESADIALVAGISNWWGWGIAGLLSAATGRWLLPSSAEEKRLLSAVIASGGVDGCTHHATLSVDGQPLSDYLLILSCIEDALERTALVQA